MDNTSPDNKETSLRVYTELHRELTLFDKEILKSGEEGTIYHHADFNMLPVTHLHTYNVDESIIADYNYGAIIRKFEADTGKCVDEHYWNPGTREEFRGGQGCAGFVMTAGPEIGMLRGFELSTPRSMIVQTRHIGRINDLILMHWNGITITCSDDGTVQMYSTDAWEHLHTFGETGGPGATAMTLIPTTSWIAVGYSDGRVCIFDSALKEKIGEFQVAPLPVRSISSNGRLLCIAFADALVVCDLAGNVIREHVAAFPFVVVRCPYADILSHTPDCLTEAVVRNPFITSRMVSGASDGRAYVYDLENGELLRTIDGHNDTITSILISPQEYIITGSLDGAVRRYHYPTDRCVNVYHTSDQCRSISLNAGGTLMCVSGHLSNTAKLLDLSEGTIKAVFHHQNTIRESVIDDKGTTKRLFTAGWDRMVREWDLATGKEVRCYEMPGRVSELHLFNDRLYIGYYGRQKPAGFAVADSRTGEILFQETAHAPIGRFGRSILLCPLDPVFFSAGDDGRLIMWDLNKKRHKHVVECESSIRILYALREQGWLLAGHDNDALSVYALSDLSFVRSITDYMSTICTITGSKDILFLGDAFGFVYAIDSTNLEIQWVQRYHNGRVWQLVLSPSGKLLMSASDDGTVKFIRIETGEVLADYYNLDEGFLWVASPGDEENQALSYYWTDRPDRIIMRRENRETREQMPISDEQRKAHHAVYNNQRIVMSLVADSSYHEIVDDTKQRMAHQAAVGKMLKIASSNLLTEYRGE